MIHMSMNTITKKLLSTVEQLDADRQADVLAYAAAKVEEPHVMSKAELIACEEGYKNSSRGIFAPKEALQDTLKKLRNA